MGSVVDLVVGALRGVPIRGKGRALSFLAPRSGTRTARIGGDAVMTLDLANAIQRMIYLGCFAPEITACLRTLLPAGGTFVDVGANVGYFSLRASHLVGPSGRVFAVEPNPATFARMKANLEGSVAPNVRAEMIALAEAEGALRLYVPPEGEHRDYNVTMVANPDWTPVEVPCHRLDDRLAEWGVDRVDLMKIDVEGAEPRVLAGGADRLKGGVVRHLILEINGPYLTASGGSPAQLVAQLAALGFVPARLSGGRALPDEGALRDLPPDYNSDQVFLHQSAR